MSVNNIKKRDPIFRNQQYDGYSFTLHQIDAFCCFF